MYLFIYFSFILSFYSRSRFAVRPRRSSREALYVIILARADALTRVGLWMLRTLSVKSGCSFGGKYDIRPRSNATQRHMTDMSGILFRLQQEASDDRGRNTG